MITWKKGTVVVAIKSDTDEITLGREYVLLRDVSFPEGLSTENWINWAEHYWVECIFNCGENGFPPYYFKLKKEARVILPAFL